MSTTKSFRLILLFVFVGVWILSACQTASPQSQNLSPRLQKIQQAGKIVIGTALTAPFESRNQQSGELEGFDVEIAKIIAAKIGVPIEWKEMAFADLIPTLQDGKVDMVIAGMYITDQRKELVDLSTGYVDTGLAVVSQANAEDVSTKEQLAGKIVCVKTGSTGARFAQGLVDQGIALTIQEYADTVASLEDLSAGNCDVALNDKINSIQYIKSHGDLKVADEVLEPAQMGAAVQKGDQEMLDFINATIEEIKADQTLEKLYNQWILSQ